MGNGGGVTDADGRWDRLLDDLGAEFEAAERAELSTEVTDRSRREVGQLRLVDRLRAAVDHPVTIAVLGHGRFTGVLREVGADWLLLDEPSRRAALVPLTSVSSVTGVGAGSAQRGSEGHVGGRLDLRYAVRRLVRDRAPLVVLLVDGAALSGTCDRVGVDFLELAEHAVGEQRRPAAVRQVSTVPLSALAVLQVG